MKFKVYEYNIKNKVIGDYTGSFTLKEGCLKEQELKKGYKAKLVDEFESIYHRG